MALDARAFNKNPRLRLLRQRNSDELIAVPLVDQLICTPRGTNRLSKSSSGEKGVVIDDGPIVEGQA
jgi:hypothetical protein